MEKFNFENNLYFFIFLKKKKKLSYQYTESKLTEICILDSPHLTDEAFRYLSNAKQLRKLKIASNRNLSDNAIKYIAKNCIELK